MRIWDIEPRLLCDQHLLGEHRELHGLFNILTLNKLGYSRHPETLRWVGRTKALWYRHAALVAEMEDRGFQHQSPLEGPLEGPERNERRLASDGEQLAMLAAKNCFCKHCQQEALANV